VNDAGVSPDLLFMEKCSALVTSEPVLNPFVAPKLLWTLYAMDYGHTDRPLLMKLLESMSKNHKMYREKDVVSTFKAMAHFDVVHQTAKENLLKNAIQHGAASWSFESLSDICYSLAALRDENRTFLEIVAKRVRDHGLVKDKI